MNREQAAALYMAKLKEICSPEDYKLYQRRWLGLSDPKPWWHVKQYLYRGRHRRPGGANSAFERMC